MAKKKTAKKKAKGKSDKDALAKGAAEIAAAKKEQKELEPVVIPESTRPLDEIISDRVEVLSGHIGLKIADDTPIEESLRILDWTTSLSEHVGFMIGDVLNFGNAKWGEKYTQALSQTGRALSTLKGYAEASRRIPADKRRTALSFSQHREILRLPDEKMEGVLEEVATMETPPSVKELRFKIQKLTPRRKKTSKRATSGKGPAKKAKPEAPAYKPTDEEQSKLDQAEDALKEAAEAIKAGKIYQLVAKLDNKEKKRWTEMALPIVNFYNAVDRVTGY